MKYAVNLTISPEIAQCNLRMRPFVKKGVAHEVMHPVLAVDIGLKHVSVEFLIKPLDKRTFIDHERGMVLIGLPADISGYHAHSVLLGDRGLQMLSRIAYEASLKPEGVCAESPACYAGYLYDLWACMQDHLAAEVTLDAREMLLKELRLKLVTQTGRSLGRFENALNPSVGHIYLYDADTGSQIATPEDLADAVEYRVKKAAVNCINIEGLEDRLAEIYRFCRDESASLSIERQIDRPMPKSVSYTSFAYAISDAALSFQIAENGSTCFGDVSNQALLTAEEMVSQCQADGMTDTRVYAAQAEERTTVKDLLKERGDNIIKIPLTKDKPQGVTPRFESLCATRGKKNSLPKYKLKGHPQAELIDLALVLPSMKPSANSSKPICMSNLTAPDVLQARNAAKKPSSKKVTTVAGPEVPTYGEQMELFDSSMALNDVRRRNRCHSRAKRDALIGGRNSRAGAGAIRLRPSVSAKGRGKTRIGVTAPSSPARILNWT